MYDLDLVEVLFEDQYFSRSAMSRIRNSMVCMVSSTDCQHSKTLILFSQPGLLLSTSFLCS